MIKYETLIVCPREITLTEVYPAPTGSSVHANSDAQEELSGRAIPLQDALANQAPRIVTDAGNSVALKLGGSVSVTSEVDTYVMSLDVVDDRPSACTLNFVTLLSSKCTGLTQFAVVLDDHCAETRIVPKEQYRVLSFGKFEPVTYTTLPPEIAIPVGVTELSVTAARDVNVSALLTKLPFCFTLALNTAAVEIGSSVTTSAELTK